MKMNMDCIRDILLEAEDFPLEPYGVESLSNSIEKYGEECVEYNVLKLIESGLVRGVIEEDLSGIPCVLRISDITFQGHEFLNKVRDQKHWTVIKAGFNAVRNYSLDAISAIANGVASAAIAAYLEKNPPL